MRNACSLAASIAAGDWAALLVVAAAASAAAATWVRGRPCLLLVGIEGFHCVVLENLKENDVAIAPSLWAGPLLLR